MKKTWQRAVMAAAALTLGVANAPAWAQTTGAAGTSQAAPEVKTTPPAVIGIVDAQAAFEQSLAGKSLVSQVNARRKALEQEIATKGNALSTQEQQLLAKKATLSEADYGKKLNELKAQIAKFNQDRETKAKALEQAYQKAFDQIRMAFAKLMPEIARVHGFNIVLQKGAVLLSSDSWDVTKEAVKKLDAALPAVKLQ
ncbi:MAG TPA: OmpH family outer membrane protein [Dongiaceae bacterium]|jgi:Skp family chaperone for outer membrane proteins|nr:OmpH family outer membrane protein [Dongiaceae bacterium]